jgi:Caspase domain
VLHLAIRTRLVLGVCGLPFAEAYAQAPAETRDFSRLLEAYGTPQEVGVGRFVALLFAAQDYQAGTGVPDLKTPNHDVAEIGEVLEDQYGFDVQVFLDVTRGDIFTAIEQLSGELTEDDVVLLYYAGHGVLRSDEKLGYWLPVDADQKISTNWVSTADVSAKVRAMRARHVLLIADSCYAGQFVREVDRDTPLDAPVGPEEATALASSRSRWVITSGGNEPVSDGGADGMSVFGYFLKETLRTSKDRYVVPDRFFPLLRSAVVENSDQTPVQGKLDEGTQMNGQPVLINQVSCSPEGLQILSARTVADADRDWDEVVRSSSGRSDALFHAAIVGWIGRWSEASVQACGVQQTVKIPRISEALRLRDQLTPQEVPPRKLTPWTIAGVTGGVVGAVSLLGSIPLDRSAHKAHEEGDFARRDRFVTYNNIAYFGGFGSIGTGVVLGLTGFAINGRF